jgi:hypothetical protein
MKALLIGLLALGSLSAQAEVLLVQSCSNKTSLFTLAVYFENIPGSRIFTNIQLAELSINPDQTTRRISNDEATAEDRVFNSAEKARQFFLSNDILLTNSSGKQFIYSAKNLTLRRIEAGKESAPINCRND